MNRRLLLRRFDKIITWIITPLLPTKTKRLVTRRQGIIEHIKLERVFKKIGNDPYVKASRSKYE